MNKQKKTLSALAVLFLILLCCTPKEKPNPEFVNFISCDTIQLEGKITYPEIPANNKLIIKVEPCLVSKFSPDRGSTNDKIKKLLLANGCTYFNFLGRKDSITIYNKKYPAATMHTKAQDLEAAISFIKSRKDLKSKEIILFGVSEGGAISAIVASKNPNIDALILLSTPGVSGKEFMTYQQDCKNTKFMTTLLGAPPVAVFLDEHSSLDTPIKVATPEIYLNWIKENFEQLNMIGYRYENIDSIAYHVMQTLREKWDKEDSVTKTRYKGSFEEYIDGHKEVIYIQPEQVALKHWDPEPYFTKISCPVFCLYGSLDKNVEYSSSIENIERLLKKNNNQPFVYVLYGYDHGLKPAAKNHKSDLDSCINKVVDWTINLK